MLTQGLGTILRARHLVLVAAGAGKAEAVAAAVEGPVSAVVPGVGAAAAPACDGARWTTTAAAGLARADHYREVYAGKPAWQGSDGRGAWTGR